MGIETVVSPYLYAPNGSAAGNAKERAEVLNRFYEDSSIDAVFDLSGGDMANEVLPYVDFQAILENDKTFYGYSDLTVLLGTFTEIERDHHALAVYEMMKEYLPEKMFVAQTSEIGHAIMSKALRIG